MAELKTQKNDASVRGFIEHLDDEKKRHDAHGLLEIMEELTGEAPKMWGSSIIGFGEYHYKYDSGREGEWFRVGFSPRKQNLSLYLMGNADRETLLSKLGKHKTGKGCLYIKRLEDVNLEVLTELIRSSYTYFDKN